MLEPFSYAFAVRGLVEVLLLSVGAGVLGTWIVMRATLHQCGAITYFGQWLFVFVGDPYAISRFIARNGTM